MEVDLIHSAFLRIRDVPRRVIFGSCRILMLPGIFWVYFSIPFFTSPNAPVTTGTVMVFIFRIHSISTSRSLYFASFSIIFLTEEFLSFGIVKSLSRLPFFSFLPLMTTSDLFVPISHTLCIGMSHKIATSSLSVNVWGSYSYHFSFVIDVKFFT